MWNFQQELTYILLLSTFTIDSVKESLKKYNSDNTGCSLMIVNFPRVFLGHVMYASANRTRCYDENDSQEDVSMII